ncbi:hypothetical protein R1flu_008015 [Riccia fluitans]|uniref:Uncharacterized protein n=1 Tax=Riccia fluitans TaxID=41844 RepID=A0ABD1YAN8_9MARC
MNSSPFQSLVHTATNEDDYTPLHRAVLGSHLEIARSNEGFDGIHVPRLIFPEEINPKDANTNSILFGFHHFLGISLFVTEKEIGAEVPDPSRNLDWEDEEGLFQEATFEGGFKVTAHRIRD